MKEVFTNKNIGYYVSADVCHSYRTKAREIKTYEIELYNTSTNISVVNNVNYEQKRGNILVAKPGDVRYSINSFECYYVHFCCNDEEIARGLDMLPTVFSLKNSERIAEIFKNLIWAKKMKNIQYSLYVQGKLTELVSLLLFDVSQKYNGRYKRYEGEIKSACEYMKSNFEQQITLEDVAKKVNLSAGYFHKVFKEIKSMTPAQYLTEIRINSAKDMLKGSNVPLSEIAVSCGFGSQSYFNYVFAKHTSQTPKKYRDKNMIII